MRNMYSILLFVLALSLSSCSMVGLFFSDAISPNADSEDETKGKIEFMNLTAVSSDTETVLSWDDYFYMDNRKRKTVSSYQVLRSTVSPWEGFIQASWLSNNLTATTNTWTDHTVTTSLPRVYYRIRCSYSISTKNGLDKYTILSEAVTAP